MQKDKFMGNLKLIKDLNPFYLLLEPKRSWYQDFILYVYFLIILYFILHFITYWMEKKLSTVDIQTIYNHRKIARRFFLLFAVIFAFPIFYHRLDYLPTFLGIIAAAITISLKEVTLSIVAWFIIRSSHGFEVGDRIEVDGVKGDVIDITLLKFSLIEVNKERSIDQSTNRIVSFPNNFVILYKIFIVSQKMDYVWDEIHFYISIDSDIDRVELLLQEILKKAYFAEVDEIERQLREVSKRYLMKLGVSTPIVYTTLEEGKVMISLRYLTRIKQKRQNRSQLSRAVIHALKKEKKIKIIS